MTSEVTIGGITLALITLMTKVWLDSTRQTEWIIDVVKQNAIAMTSLENAVKVNTEVTQAVGKSTESLTVVNKSLSDKIGNVIRHRS